MKLEGGRMELKDIKELMKVLKKEKMHEIKVRYGKVKLTIKNSEDPNIDNIRTEIKTEKKEEQKIDTVKEEIVKSQNVGEIKLANLEKGMPVQKGMKLGKISTIGVETDVKSPVNGVLKEILVSDQAAVDFAKPLFIIEVL
jgi:pyruvate carboxylase 1